MEYKGTTAGWKNTFAYDKLIQLLVWEIVKPDRAMILGGTWRVPAAVKLLDKNFIKELKMDGTFNESSFDREYRQICTHKIIVNCEKILRAA